MKRRLFKLVVFLLLGAATTIATSWYFAAGRTKDGEWFGHAEQGSSRIERIGAGTWHVYRNERLGQVLIRRYRSIYSPEDQPPEWDIIDWPAERFLPVWASDLLTLKPPEGVLGNAALEGSGWPVVAMRTRYDEVPGPLRGQSIRRVTGGILLTPTAEVRLGDMLYSAKALHLRPLWPGCAINTAFYAVLLWMLRLSPFVVRRAIRRKRGRCIKCGYDLRGTPGGGGGGACPECGMVFCDEGNR
ncbi:MAG: hypothetical protein IIA64_12345 [Planctomycetes bacterium]|nr:hypothetical protein [Planctomycetota bacterium]